MFNEEGMLLFLKEKESRRSIILRGTIDNKFLKDCEEIVFIVITYNNIYDFLRGVPWVITHGLFVVIRLPSSSK